ncbi:myc box-dependent-interacting protein 1-like [Rhincodon typus]|uniref:myc box-dependent-interacting protein 1-like n=1 Tax=Rhincodon typus TaxID=259920 RepID=UPI0020305B0D|nr:myc box-dependent-interacting protein 1-like [Rhincodon typus]
MSPAAWRDENPFHQSKVLTYYHCDYIIVSLSATHFASSRAHSEGIKLQKDLRAYLVAVKAMHEATKKLSEVLEEIYEPDWVGRQEIHAISENGDLLWTDYHQKLVDQALLTLDTYLGQFPDIKVRLVFLFAKICKKQVRQSEENQSLVCSKVWAEDYGGFIVRYSHRALVKVEKSASPPEYESPPSSPVTKDDNHVASTSPAPHVPSIPKSPSQQRKGPPVPPPPKITPSKDIKQENILNLFDDSFIPEISVTTPSQFEAPGPLQDEGSLLDLDFDPLKPESSSVVRAASPVSQSLPWDLWEPEKTASNSISMDQSPRMAMGDGLSESNFAVDWPAQPSLLSKNEGATAQAVEQVNATGEVAEKGAEDKVASDVLEAQPEPKNESLENETGTDLAMSKDVLPAVVTETLPAATNGAVYDSVPVEDMEMPPGFQFKVRAVHDYNATDTDELNLKAGDVIFVVTHENPEEQDEGWLMGIKEIDWIQRKDLKTARSVFPENFTERVQ